MGWLFRPIAWRASDGRIKRAVLAFDMESPNWRLDLSQVMAPTLVLRGDLDGALEWAAVNGLAVEVRPEQIVHPGEGAMYEAAAEF
jgi:hypothetical protein